MLHATNDASVPTGPSAPAKPATLEQCHEVIAAMAARLQQLEGKLAELQERLKLNSRNSSKPPSSDGPGSGSGGDSGNRAQRRASQRLRGAQKGHPGSFRALVDEGQVDRIVDCAPPSVCECGAPVQATGRRPGCASSGL